MTDLNPAMRLKVKGDTFFLPIPNEGVYFRNNYGSFRMEGSTIDQWIEKLVPVLSGEHTLADLTDGLPDPYRNQVYAIATQLYQNGFVRDVSQDRPHRLPPDIVAKYAAQIEFLDSLGGSGAHRFEQYREARVLVVGSGPFLASLVSSLLESGLPRFGTLVTDAAPTNRQRIAELAAHARTTDAEVAIGEVVLRKEAGEFWREAVQPFEYVLYVSETGDMDELLDLEAICKELNKALLPAVCVQQAGMAGPLDGRWESAWRRIHRSALSKDPQLHRFSPTAGAMLANVIVFELFKTVTGTSEAESRQQVYMLNMETLEGSWHSFVPHPLVNGYTITARVAADDPRFKRNPDAGRSDPNGLFAYFSRLTSAQSGIFHVWEEGELIQLPLSQCRVQAADPLSEGPAELLPDVVCAGFTHEEARREAGLTGIEAYVSRMAGASVAASPSRQEGGTGQYVGVGAGVTAAEAVIRGLQKCLALDLGKRHAVRPLAISRVRLGSIDDPRCRFYLQALNTMRGEPIVAYGEEVFGFPVVWVGAGGRWYGSADLNPTLALRKSLQHALQREQNGEVSLVGQTIEAPSVLLSEDATQSLDIPSCEEAADEETMQSAFHVLHRNRKRLLIYELAAEPFLREGLAGVFGVLLREEETP